MATDIHTGKGAYGGVQEKPTHLTSYSAHQASDRQCICSWCRELLFVLSRFLCFLPSRVLLLASCLTASCLLTGVNAYCYVPCLQGAFADVLSGTSSDISSLHESLEWLVSTAPQIKSLLADENGLSY